MRNIIIILTDNNSASAFDDSFYAGIGLAKGKFSDDGSKVATENSSIIRSAINKAKLDGKDAFIVMPAEAYVLYCLASAEDQSKLRMTWYVLFSDSASTNTDLEKQLSRSVEMLEAVGCRSVRSVDEITHLPKVA